MTKKLKTSQTSRRSAAHTRAKPAARKTPTRKADAPALKEQKAAATREAVAVIQWCSGLSASEVEVRLGIGRAKHSKRDGKSGELINSYLKADTDRDTAGDPALARLMFSAVRHGLLDPQRFISMSARPGIRRAILPVRSLLLQLAIRGASCATEAETEAAYKKWCAALAAKKKTCKNERDAFKAWKSKVQKGLPEFVRRLESMKHHAWTLTHPAAQSPVEVDGHMTVDSQQAFIQRAFTLRAMIDAIELDPLHELDGDLPDVADSDEEKAEILRQLSLAIECPREPASSEDVVDEAHMDVSFDQALAWYEEYKASLEQPPMLIKP